MNVSGHIAGTTNTPLTDQGRQQATLAGQHIKHFDIDYIVSSPLSRALETAQIIAKEIGYPVENVHTNSLLVERAHGSLEGTPWSPDLNLDGFADVETIDNLLGRAKLALDFLHTVDAENLLVVSHGGFGRALRQHIVGDDFYDRTNLLGNAEIVQWL